VSVYRVHLTWKGKELVLKAKSLDLTHPYFVSIRDIMLPDSPKLIIDPNEDEMRKMFGSAEHLMIPFQTVTLIEECREDVDRKSDRIRTFTLVEEESKNVNDSPEGGGE